MPGAWSGDDGGDRVGDPVRVGQVEVVGVRAAVGDEIMVETDTVGQVRRRGEVLEVLTTAGEHYRVRWDDGRESLLFPGPDARIRHVGDAEDLREVERSASAAGAGSIPSVLPRVRPTEPIRAIMATSVVSIDGAASVRAVADRLTEAEVGALMVSNGHAAPGIVSERDVVHAVAAGDDLDAVCAADLEAPETVWAETTDSIRDVAALMHRADVRHIPLRTDGRLVGVVSVRDVLSVLLEG
jgi:CBS domain-containing protein